MARGNTVAISGNLTSDPKVHTFDSGTSKATFGLAWNEDRKNDQGGWDKIGHFFEVEVWSGTVKVAVKFSKGNLVTVFGRLAWRKWEKDGIQQERVYIVADSLFGDHMYDKASGDQDSQQFGDNAAEPARARSRPAAAPDSQPRARTRATPGPEQPAAINEPIEGEEDPPW